MFVFPSRGFSTLQLSPLPSTVNWSLKTVSVVWVAEICLSCGRADASELQGEGPWPGAQQRGHRRLLGKASFSSINILCFVLGFFLASLDVLCCFKVFLHGAAFRNVQNDQSIIDSFNNTMQI